MLRLFDVGIVGTVGTVGLVRTTVGVTVCAAVVSTAACRSVSDASGSSSRSPAPSSPLASHVSVADPANGTTLRVAVGGEVDVTLHSTYWQFRAVQPGSVLRASAPTYRPIFTHPPGMGRGTVREVFTALRAGTATISAGRRLCGEALRCTGDRGTYGLTVVVA